MGTMKNAPRKKSLQPPRASSKGRKAVDFVASIVAASAEGIVIVTEDFLPEPPIVVDTEMETAVDFQSDESGAHDALPSTNVEKETSIMALIFTKSTKDRKTSSVVYNAPSGYRGSVRMPVSLFGENGAPETLAIDSDSFAAMKSKLTAQERKVLRANAPKLTAAEKLVKLQARAAKLQAAVDADAAKIANGNQ